MAGLPCGTVTFLFTDIEGSTSRWERQPEAMRRALARHDAILRAAILAHGGHVVKTMGDAFHAAFSRPLDGVLAALEGQHRLGAEPWDEIGPGLGGLRVRMALHTGAAEERDGDYYGPELNRAARLLSTGHGGQVLLSSVTAGLVRDALPGDVSLLDLGEHRLKDLVRPERVFQLVAADLPAQFPPLRSLDARPNNLPTHPTALLGRDREVAEVAGLLRGDVRLVTLTGPGGTGKTRLSLQVAAELLDPSASPSRPGISAAPTSGQAFGDGAFVVELAPISDPALIPTTIAQALGVREAGGRPVLEALTAYLREKSLLLVLDNFEQIVAGASVVAELLAACPGLKALVSSREPLQVRGEREYAVPPLALPDPRQAVSPERVAESPAVALFVQRAQAVRAGFEVTPENAVAIAEICTRLDGLPLAIELAAARVRLLPPQALVQRLEHRLSLLVGGARDLPPRQQTLRGAIDWSHDLLDEDERRLFRRLSVFVGGWTLDAAEAVCNPDGSLDVLTGLESLVAKSLVRADEVDTDEPRFRMLQTIREYGRECLESSPEAPSVRRQFVTHYLQLAEHVEPIVRGAAPGQVRALRILEREHDNLRQILHWGPEQGVDATIRLRLATALGWFWFMHGHIAEGRDFLDRALSTAISAPPALRGHALIRLGQIAQQQGDLDAAERYLEESLRECRGAGDSVGTAWALTTLGGNSLARGTLDQAVARHTEAIALFRVVPDAWGVGHATFGLGMALTAFGEYDRAVEMLHESLAMRTGLDPAGVGLTLRALGRLALRQGDLPTARARLRESLAPFQETGSRAGLIGCLEGLGQLALDEGQVARGAVLLSSASRLRDADGTPGRPTDRAELARRADEARAALGDAAFEAARAEGAAMSLERAIAYALEEISPS
jgi:predicted ATPase/class 3 adenylate cyclase